jgi:putative spermidine/putrescine transport system permease protein
MSHQPFSSSARTGAVLDAPAVLEQPQQGRRDVLLLAPGLVFLSIFLVIPLTLSLWYSLHPDRLAGGGGAALSLANYAYLLRHGIYVDAFARTLRLAGYVVISSLLIGYPAALVLRRLHGRMGSTLILALSFPILAGPVVIVMGWMLLLPRSGPVGHLLVALGLVRQPPQLIGTEAAVELALVQFTLAFVVLHIFNSLMRLDRSLVEAAGSLGADPIRAFWHVTWPLSLPGVFSASILAFALTLGAFMAPYYLGGDTQLVATTLVAQFMLTAFSWGLSSTAAILLVVMALVMMFAYHRTVIRMVERRFGL